MWASQKYGKIIRVAPYWLYCYYSKCVYVHVFTSCSRCRMFSLNVFTVETSVQMSLYFIIVWEFYTYMHVKTYVCIGQIIYKPIAPVYKILTWLGAFTLSTVPTWRDASNGHTRVYVLNVFVSGSISGWGNVPKWDKAGSIFTRQLSGVLLLSQVQIFFSRSDCHWQAASPKKERFCIYIPFTDAPWWGAIWFVHPKSHGSLDWWLYTLLAVMFQWAERLSHNVAG